MFEDACNALDQKRNGMMDQMRRRKRVLDFADPHPTVHNNFIKTLIENGLLDHENDQIEEES